jgi:uncharacterized protein (TIGR02466 family)
MAANFTLTFKPPGTSKAAPATSPALRSFDLFPTRIWQASLTQLTPQQQNWITSVLAQREAHPRPAGRTNRQGWNSEDMAVLEQPVFALLAQAVRAGCATALNEMGVRAPFQLQSWINMHDRGGFNFPHVHEGCLLSGCFYLNVPAGSGKLVFRDPRAGVIHGYVKGAVPNGYSDIHLTPEAGLLVLFPSWMEHFVEPHDSDEARISISFNAVTV